MCQSLAVISWDEELGETIEVAGESFFAFPSPKTTLNTYERLNEIKVGRPRPLPRLRWRDAWTGIICEPSMSKAL
jgi:hypothetical protein